MLEMRHPNILQLFGLFIKNNTPMIVTEYMNRGDLLHLLQTEGDITTRQLAEFCQHISLGMEYLHSKKILHRDLACRNILVSGKNKEDNLNLTVKVADFGLSRQAEDYYKVQSKKIPVRWTAPEVIEFGKASKASDVWSFGVVVWEIFSRGAIPYGGYTNQQLIRAVKKGTRLVPPYGMPQEILQIMKDCWHFEMQDRPLFSEISKQLKQSHIGAISEIRLSSSPEGSPSDKFELEASKTNSSSIYLVTQPPLPEFSALPEHNYYQNVDPDHFRIAELQDKILKLETENKRIPILEAQLKTLKAELRHH